ncbi:unnamed protein product [Caenorhabditis angaria]|uniref:PHD-type domain-containing protein n=1 Tax=Caenorhabditis angaria TaxID=860376 RepID=A0A9P1IZ10_9PELO|nr:unnamed protein product [Caenorhabditis angaria]
METEPAEVAADIPEDSNQSEVVAEESSQAAPVSSKRDSYNKNAYIMIGMTNKGVVPADVIEYEWPAKSGDRWFIQEQIGELLDIKSFSRKFPDMTRRKVNHEERAFLEQQYNVHNLLNETLLRDMNAMRSTEVHDLMNNEYPDIYLEYKKIITQKEREIALEKAKEMEAIKNDKVKLAELRKKAMTSAAEFNKDLQTSRRTERKHFWDIQTNIIQSRLSNWKKLSKEATRPLPYPVALIPGQYQEYYRKFSKEELMRLPVATVMDSEHLYPVYRDASPPPLSIAEQDFIRMERDQRAKEAHEAAMASLNASAAASQNSQATGDSKMAEDRKCDSCQKIEGELLCCTTCKIAYHPQCIEMPERMVKIVKTYAWSCVDCRLCSICNKPDKDDEIIFCDRCDRGFHTDCVNLDAPPKGTWICSTFCEIDKKPRGRPMRRQSNAQPMET